MTTVPWLCRKIQLGIPLVAMLVLAQEVTAQDKQSLRSNSRSGDSSPPHIRKLYGISWQPSLDAAQAAAEKASPPKPVFMLRTLGDLTGKT